MARLSVRAVQFCAVNTWKLFKIWAESYCKRGAWHVTSEEFLWRCSFVASVLKVRYLKTLSSAEIIYRQWWMDEWVWSISEMIVSDENGITRSKTCHYDALCATNPTLTGWVSILGIRSQGLAPVPWHCQLREVYRNQWTENFWKDSYLWTELDNRFTFSMFFPSRCYDMYIFFPADVYFTLLTQEYCLLLVCVLSPSFHIRNYQQVRLPTRVTAA
jgi:hypothetical protein